MRFKIICILAQFHVSCVEHNAFNCLITAEENIRIFTVFYLYCCTVHLVDSLNIILPTNALIVCHLF